MQDHSFEQLGPYRIEGIVGRGGMGNVYAGVDADSGNRAAIKVLAPGLAGNVNFRDRFESEIESLKKLRHPNIVELFGYGEQDGQLFYAMELVDGSSLQEEINGGRRFTWRDVTRITIEVCAALKHAHDHGIIHRDLKPANLLITADDSVKLSDFGIAKLFGATELTIHEGVLGTADYMAPEQAEGKAVSPQSDLYSLGCVMYALLAGRPPFRGKTLAEVVHKLRFEEPIPVGRFADDIPNELELVISQLLAKERGDRIRTAVSLSHRLRAMEQALSITPEDGEEENGPSDDTSEAATDVAIDVAVAEDIESGSVLAPGISHRPTIGLPADAPKAESELVKGPSHFTKVKDEPTSSDAGTPFWMNVLKLLAGVLAVGLIAMVGRQLIQPPTADQLYHQINKRIDDEDPLSLLDVESRVQEFLGRYASDERHDEIKALSNDIDLYKLQRRFEARARDRRGQTKAALSPVEQIYLEAVRDSQTNPEAALAKLQAMTDAFGNQPDAESRQLQCILLAHTQMARLRESIAAASKAHTKAIRQRINYADELTEYNVEEAIQVLQGVIELYREKEWAFDLIEEARQKLDALETTSP